eukprot:SAG22_NODE_681_length_7933_cov_27.729257_6_plen_88_part_00
MILSAAQILEPIITACCGGGAEDMAVNTVCEDVDGRIEDLGEAIADMVVDGGSWGAQVRAMRRESALTDAPRPAAGVVSGNALMTIG